MALKVTHTETKMGRPKLDVEALILKVYYEAPKALNNEELAEFLGIHVASIYELIKDNSDFNEAIKHYRRISPIEVLNSFKKLAVGYSVDETTKELKKDGTTHKMTITKIVTKHFPPNASAGQFYLKNQMPEHFKDKTETVHSVAGDMESITFTAKRREINDQEG